LCSLIDGHYGAADADYARYQADPVAFGKTVLGESYTEGIRLMLQSVRDNPFTVIKSANAVGKSHGSARAAMWFYKSYPNSQVYTAVAPPQQNPEKILWGAIGSLVEKHPNVFKSDRLPLQRLEALSASFKPSMAKKVPPRRFSCSQTNNMSRKSGNISSPIELKKAAIAL